MLDGLQSAILIAAASFLPVAILARLTGGRVAPRAAAVGLALLWIRERTGSLVLPLLFHSLVNVGNQFL